MSGSFVVYLSSEGQNYNDGSNAYGYWMGKTYVFQGNLYPVCAEDKNHPQVKKYVSRARAENAAIKALKKFGQVMRSEVEEI